jgi:hypothetical protein
VGEIALVTGFLILLRASSPFAILTMLSSFVLAAMMVWVLLRTLPFLGTHGFDALRDSVVIMYGGFAFIVIALLLEDSGRINYLIRLYGKFATLYSSTILVLFALSSYMVDYIPRWPGYDVPFLSLKAGEVTTHLAGAAVFSLVGFRRAGSISIALLGAAAVMASATSRGAMLAIALPLVFAALVLGKVRTVVTVLVTGLVIFGAAYALEASLTNYREATTTDKRSVSPRQLANNIASIVGQAGQQTESTKTWRLDWWDMIVKDTVYGPNFWTGRGFGLNLAQADGFETTDVSGPPLRSPHSVHMTILARSGVTGLGLWVLLLVSWFAALMSAALTARARGQAEWFRLFLFVGCYAMSIIINASFDVALEGPVQGVWFWCIIGFGIGSTMVYRAQLIGVMPRWDRSDRARNLGIAIPEVS